LHQAQRAELLRRARQHDPEALTALVDQYSPRVYALLYRLTGSRDVADDLLQDTFLRVVRTIGEYEESGRFEAWLFRIAANLARDRVRRSRRRGVTASLEAFDPEVLPVRADRTADNPEARLAGHEASEHLAAGLEQLSDPEREILMLRHYSELSFREIAEVLGIPIGTALARAHRALGRLRAWMEQAPEP
jgi:RNA polymerase sigma-70 factor (ECF subfamily)